jgi:hypothetical protein
MKLIKITALFSLVCAFSLTLSSCEKDSEDRKRLEFSKTAIIMSGAQETPLSNSSALGTMDVNYRRDTKILNYKITWSGLTGTPIGIGVHGTAPTGFNPYSPAAWTTPVQSFTLTGLTATGTYSGALLVDGFAVKEEDVLSGLYYINLRTASYPAGEIRGQVKFQ